MNGPADELAAVIAEMERTGASAQITDAEWRLVWVSRELKALLGSEDEHELGYGGHIVAAYASELWSATISPESQAAQFTLDIPMMIADTPGGKEALARMLPDEAGPFLDQLEAKPLPPLWTSELDFLQGDLPPARVRVMNVVLCGRSGRLGVVRMYGSALPATLLSLVGRGDQRMFERMARLMSPRRRSAAILFADLQASGALARKLSTAAYFSLIRELTTAVDQVVIERGGIVGKHAGDGITAFFIEDDLGSASATARAAIDAAREITAAAERSAGAGPASIEPGDCRFNVGIHWGATLYMGQVVTGGRIEVTALGDEVNEAARVEQAAQDGAVLASKPLVERLGDEDAAALGLAPDALTYRPLADLPGVSEKGVRDAGGIAVTDVAGPT